MWGCRFRQGASSAVGSIGIVVGAMVLTAWTAERSISAADIDPLERRSPSKPAEFRNRMPDPEYRRAAAPIISRLALVRKEAADNAPSHGLRLSDAFGLGPLGTRGLGPADVITKAGGKELWGRWPEPREEPITFQIYQPGQNRTRSLNLASDLGSRYSVYRRPEIDYFRGTRRTAAWDRDVLVGLASAASTPYLAEAAWYRALAAGCPRSRICLESGATLALAQDRPETALDFWREAERIGGSETLDPLLGYRVMIANFQLESARDLARKNPELLPHVATGLETLIALHRALPAAERALPSPSVRAKGMHRRDSRGLLVGGSPAAENQFLDRLTRWETFQTNPVSNHYSLVDLSLERAIKDYALKLTFTFGPTDSQRADFVKLVRLTFSGSKPAIESDGTDSTLIAQVEFEVPSGFGVTGFEGSGPIYFPDPLVIGDGRARNSLRLIRVGSQMEAFVNGRRVLYQPIDRELMLRHVQLQAVGVTIEISEFSFDELIPRL
jgi:hypothetical protein